MAERKFSAQLESELFPYRTEFREVMNGWIGDGMFGFTYPAFLVETFHYVKHSCSLMNYACAQLGPEYREIQLYLARHIAEEVGHEAWVLNDLEHLGFDRKQVEASVPLPETINLIGSQLYVINYLHPAGLLGYVYVMESQPPTEKSLRLFHEGFGIPTRAMSFLIRHGESDKKHKIELANMLDNHFHGSKEREAARLSAVLGLSNVNRMLLRIRRGKYVVCLPQFISQELLGFSNQSDSSIDLPLAVSQSNVGTH